MLKPLPNIHKFLISSPTKFVGQYEQPDLLIASSHPSINDDILRNAQNIQNPFSKYYYVFVLEFMLTENEIIIPDASYLGDYLAIALSVYYGKRFDNHGVWESQGLYSMPIMNNTLPTANYKLPSNNQQVRKDLEITLDFSNCGAILKFLTNHTFDKLSRAFFTAGKFYLRSLQSVDTDIERAFIDLITCGEILANQHEYTDDELYDEGLLNILQELKDKNIKESSINGIKARLYQVKRKFLVTLISLLNQNFFNKTESHEAWGSLKQEKIEEVIKSAYDLRSKYLHTGINFKTWIEPTYSMNEITGLSSQCKPNLAHREILESLNENERKQLEKYLYTKEVRELEKILIKAPTYIGLERIIRFSLLSFLHNNGVYIHDDLKPDTESYCWLPNAT